MNQRLLVLSSLLIGTLVGVLAWRLANGDAEQPPLTVAGTESSTSTVRAAQPPSTSAITTTIPIPLRTAYVTTRPGTILSPGEGIEGSSVAGGIVFPVVDQTPTGFIVLDSCNNEGWVAANDVEYGQVPVTRSEDDFEGAVFVIDPGHGLPDYGAIGPNGLAETEVNLAVAARLAQLINRSNDIDPVTGEVSPGSSVPSAIGVMTRAPDGPNGGDYQLGLTFRTQMANSLDATALISIHNNTVAETTLDHPGSEAFVSVENPESPRLGALIVEELRTTFARFEADWAGSPGDGLITRIDPDGTDFYTLLDAAEVPAVIVEGAYISNPTEEALARTDEFRQAYAEAVYRALVRFVTTDEQPIPPPDPVVWETNRPGPSLSSCQVPPA